MSEHPSNAEDYATIELAQFIAGLRFADLPGEVVRLARLCVADAAGCLVAGHRSDVGEAVGKLLSASDERGNIRIPGSDLKTTMAYAAFTNATLINALDFDDIFTKGHPGATVNAAAISVGQAVGSSNLELLEAVIAGYETSCRVAIALQQTAPRKHVHGHGTWQVFGAAATAAKLMRLDVGQTSQALAIAAANAPLASVMKTVYGARPSMAKNNFGAAAWVGVNAAQMAAAGFEGPLDIFEGETGYWRMFGADGWDREAALSGLGRRFEFLKVGFKNYSTCRLVQSSVEAAVAARNAFGGDVENGLRDLRILGPEILSRRPFALAHPRDMWAAQFSVPYAVALALLDVSPGPVWFEQHMLGDERVHRLAAKVVVEPSPHKPSHPFHAATAILTTTNGQTHTQTVEVAKGEYAAPMSEAEVVAKARRLVGDHDATGIAAKLTEIPLEPIPLYLSRAEDL